MKLGHEGIVRVVVDGRGVGQTRSGAPIAPTRGGGLGVVGGREAEELLRLSDLASQGVGRCALALLDKGGHTHAGLTLRGSGPGSDKGGCKGRAGLLHV